VKIANSALKRCQDEGGKDCEGSAIRQANGKVGKQKESGMQYKAYTMSTNNVLIPVNAIDVGGEAVPVAELVAAYEEAKIVDGKSEEAKEIDESVTGSLHDYANRVEDAFRSAFGRRSADGYIEGPWSRDVFKDDPDMGDAIVVRDDGQMYAVDYEEGKEGFTFADRNKWQEVVLTYKKVSEGIAEIELAESASGHAVGLAEAETSADAGPRAPLLMDVALIEPGWGNKKDKHFYPPDVLKRDAHVFEGVKMYATDHRPDEKSVRTEVAVIKGCPVAFTDDGAPIAQVAVHDGDFAEQARNRKKLGTLETLECSILALGTTKKGEIDGQEANIVEAITKGQSVDWVTKAGAGGHAIALAESNTGGVKMEKEQIGKLLSESDLPQDVQERLAGGEYENEEAVKEAILKETKEPAQEPKAPQVLAESEVEKLVDETKLPNAFKAALKVAEYADEDALKAAIAEAVKDAKALTGSGRVFAQGGGEPVKDQPLSERDKTIRYNEIMDAVDGRQVPVPAE
jgi:hypothetical protein